MHKNIITFTFTFISEDRKNPETALHFSPNWYIKSALIFPCLQYNAKGIRTSPPLPRFFLPPVNNEPCKHSATLISKHCLGLIRCLCQQVASHFTDGAGHTYTYKCNYVRKHIHISLCTLYFSIHTCMYVCMFAEVNTWCCNFM
jgi:hypothetical protein